MLKKSASRVLAGTLPPHHLGGVHQRAAPYPARREPQRLNVRVEYDSPQDAAGSPSRRRAQIWRHLFVTPCALLEDTGRSPSRARAQT
jgi:hypothetical protein